MTNKQDKVNEILGFIPSELEIKVDLPSKGLFYKGGVPSVNVKPLDFEGEKALLNVHKSKMNPIDLVLKLCVEGLDTDDICLIDKLFLMLKIREVSHGTELSTLYACTNCAFDNELVFDMDQLTVNPVPDDMTDPIEIQLPKIDKPAVVRLLRVRDSRFIKNTEDILDNMWRFVTSIDGEESIEVISAVIKNLPTKDRKAILEAMFGSSYGLETKIKVECENCERVNIIDLPITEDFFTER